MSDHDYELYVEKKKARAEGLAEGRAEGLAEGRAEGRAEGKAEGLEKGSTQTLADTEAVLRDMGIAQDKIAEMQARLEVLRQSRLAQK